MKTGPGEDRSPLHLLHRASQRVDEFHAATHDLDITPRQFLVLANIEKRGGLSQTTLVERTGIDRSTMADVIRRVQRRREERRTHLLCNTYNKRAGDHGAGQAHRQRGQWKSVEVLIST
jgi:MarR family